MLVLSSYRYNKTVKGQEKLVLTQGLSLPAPTQATKTKTPEPRRLLPAPPVYHHTEHPYVVHDDTSGTAKHRAPTATTSRVEQPTATTSTTSTTPRQAQAQSATPGDAEEEATADVKPVCRTTAYRHKVREELGLVPVNKRQRANNFCKTCHKPRTKETGHSCQRGHLFCPDNAERLSLEGLALCDSTRQVQEVACE